MSEQQNPPLSLVPVQRRPGPFGPAWALLPKGQEVVKVDEATPAWDAIEQLIENEFSQVPVMSGSRVIGVFTWKSFAKRVADLRRANIKVTDEPVRECMETPTFINRDVYIDTATDWNNLDYVLVGDATQLEGVLCVSDVFAKLNDFAEAFVLIFEIEHEIRDLVSDVTGDNGLAPLIANMSLPANTRPLKLITDFTFDQYRGLMCSKVNWTAFESAFLSSREVIDEDFKQITDLRNVVFHFRRPVTTRDTDRLRRFRDSLRDCRVAMRRKSLATVQHSPAA